MQSIWRIVREPEAARDTLQEALMIVWKKRSRIQKHPNPQALILKICINAAYDYLRKHMRTLKKEIRTDFTMNSLPSSSNPEEETEKKEVKAEILEAISRLSKNQATAVYMYIFLGQPYASIAQAMGCSEKTARVHALRGRVHLSRQLAHLKPTLPKGTSNEKK